MQPQHFSPSKLPLGAVLMDGGRPVGTVTEICPDKYDTLIAMGQKLSVIPNDMVVSAIPPAPGAIPPPVCSYETTDGRHLPSEAHLKDAAHGLYVVLRDGPGACFGPAFGPLAFIDVRDPERLLLRFADADHAAKVYGLPEGNAFLTLPMNGAAVDFDGCRFAEWEAIPVR